MAAKSTVFSSDFLAVVFNATTAAGLFQNVTAGALTNLYVSLHTGTLNASSTQSTSEAAYGAYSRVAVTRTSAGWTVTNNTVNPTANITFPTSTGTPSETETYIGIGTTSSGAGLLLYWGPLSPTIGMSASGITPQLTTSSTITEV